MEHESLMGTYNGRPIKTLSYSQAASTTLVTINVVTTDEARHQLTVRRHGSYSLTIRDGGDTLVLTERAAPGFIGAINRVGRA